MIQVYFLACMCMYKAGLSISSVCPSVSPKIPLKQDTYFWDFINDTNNRNSIMSNVCIADWSRSGCFTAISSNFLLSVQ